MNNSESNTYNEKEFSQAISTNFEQSASILQLLDLKNQNKIITQPQKDLIVNNKKFTMENKLILLTCLNDASPESTIKANLEAKSKQAKEKTEQAQIQKKSNLKDNAKKLANGVDKVSRFSVD